MRTKENEMNNNCQTCNEYLGEGAEGWCDPCYSAWQLSIGIVPDDEDPYIQDFLNNY
jgi:hypothetical protein